LKSFNEIFECKISSEEVLEGMLTHSLETIELDVVEA
jgi:hypothetical protein